MYALKQDGVHDKVTVLIAAIAIALLHLNYINNRNRFTVDDIWSFLVVPYYKVYTCLIPITRKRLCFVLFSCFFLTLLGNI